MAELPELETARRDLEMGSIILVDGKRLQYWLILLKQYWEPYNWTAGGKKLSF